MITRNKINAAIMDLGVKGALEVLIAEPAGTAVYVDGAGGSDVDGLGTLLSPVASLTKALTLVTATRKNVFVLSPGTYSESAGLVWPNINGLRLVGPEQGGGVILKALGATNVLAIDPTWTGSTFEAFLENVFIDHTAQVGLKIDNSGMPNNKLLVHLKGLGTNQASTGDSVYSPHTTAGQAIRIYASDCDEIEGLFHVVTATVDDRYRFRGCSLTGGLTATGAVASELTLLATQIKTGALSFDAAMVETNAMCWYRTDAGVYTALTDAYST